RHCHGASVAKVVGPKALLLPSDQAGRLAAVGDAVSAGTLARIWQMLLKAHAEVGQCPDPAAAVEMTLVRLAFAADLPGPEEALKSLRSGVQAPIAASSPVRGGGGHGGAPLALMAAEPRQSLPAAAE